MGGTQRVACSERARRLDRRETSRSVASRDATTCATSFDAVCHRQCMQTGRRIHGCTLLLFQCSALQCPINARARGGARPYVTSSPYALRHPNGRPSGGWGAHTSSPYSVITRLVRINVRIDHTMRDGNARSGPAANTRRTEESLRFARECHQRCCPRIADDAVADARGGVGPGAPGGGVARARESPRPVSRWASGCACAAYPRAGPGAFRCEVPRHFVKCRATVLRVSYARLVYVCRRRPPWAWRRGRGSRPELAAVSIRIPIIFSDLGALKCRPCPMSTPCAPGSRYNKYKTARVLRGSAPAN